jgi:RIO-like serine/threonine protein kinase
MTATLQEDVGSASDEDTDSVLFPMRGCHELVQGVEGKLRNSRVLPADVLHIRAGLAGQDQEGALRRVAHHIPVLQRTTGTSRGYQVRQRSAGARAISPSVP